MPQSNYLSLTDYTKKYSFTEPYVQMLCRNGTLASYRDDADLLWIEDSYPESLPAGYVLLTEYAAENGLVPDVLRVRATFYGTLFILHYQSRWYINPDTMYKFGPADHMLLTQYAEQSEYSYSWLFKLCNSGKIPSVLVGKYRFVPCDVEKYIKRTRAKVLYYKHKQLFSEFKDAFYTFDPMFKNVEVSCIDFDTMRVEFMLSSGSFFVVQKQQDQQFAVIKDQLKTENQLDEDLIKTIIKAVNVIEL